MKELINELTEAGIDNVLENEPLANHTTIKIGGPADLLVEPKTVEDVQKILAITSKHNMNWRAIGRGSNLLVDDRGLEGVVIKLGDNLDSLEINDAVITVGGGFSLIKLATIISKKGLAGLEFAGGIPGSVGGAVYMNAGAHGSDISKILIRAKVLYPDGEIVELSNADMNFSYRTSALQKDGGICVEATFQLKHDDKDKVVQEMKKYKEYRRNTQPWDFPCAGSIFRNPLPEYAGQLIEKAGLKGYKLGGAQISEMHANFIVNAGGATAQDVLDLIAFIKTTILEKFQVKLETEIEIISRNNQK